MTPGWFQITLKLVLWKDGRFLAMRDSHSGLGDLPGGRIGQDELNSLTDALRRELTEELGPDCIVDLSPEPVCIFPHHVMKDNAPAIAIVYEGQLLDGQPTLSDEHTGFVWMSPEDDPAALFAGTMLDGLRKYFAVIARRPGD